MLKNRLTGIIGCTSLSSLVLGYSMPSINVNADLSRKEIIDLYYFVKDMTTDSLELKKNFFKKNNAKKDSDNSENKIEEEQSSEEKVEISEEKDKLLEEQVKKLKQNLAILCQKLSQNLDFAPFAYYAGNFVYEIEEGKWKNEDFFVKLEKLLNGIADEFLHKEKGYYKINAENKLKFEKVTTMVKENKGIKKTYIIYHPLGSSMANRENADIIVIEERISPENTVFGKGIRDLVCRVRTLNLSDIKQEGDDILLDLKNAQMCTNMGWKGKIKVDLPESNKIIEEDYPNNVKLMRLKENESKENSNVSKLDCTPFFLDCGMASFRIELKEGEKEQLVGKSNMEVAVSKYLFSGKIDLDIDLKQIKENKFYGTSEVKKIELKGGWDNTESFLLQASLCIERSDNKKNEWTCNLKVALKDASKMEIENKMLEKIFQKVEYDTLGTQYIALFNKDKKLFNYSGYEKEIDALFLDRINCAISGEDLANLSECLCLENLKNQFGDLVKYRKTSKTLGNLLKYRKISRTLDNLRSEDQEIDIWCGVEKATNLNLNNDFSILTPLMGMYDQLCYSTFYSFAPGFLNCSTVIGSMSNSRNIKGFKLHNNNRSVLSINTFSLFDKLLRKLKSQEEEEQKKNANIKTKNNCSIF